MFNAVRNKEQAEFDRKMELLFLIQLLKQRRQHRNIDATHQRDAKRQTTDLPQHGHVPNKKQKTKV